MPIGAGEDFEAVIDGCAESRPGRQSTWINQRIRSLYGELFNLGHCHTVEVWRDGALMGGLYGVQLSGAFFGESMFSREPDASKIALVYLAARLKFGGFSLLDTQFLTDHLVKFGAIEVSREKFQRLLDSALLGAGAFSKLPADASGASVLQLVNQTSKTGCSTA
jgi:leucyl/phenylalanyl-tRNA--protein transferase